MRDGTTAIGVDIGGTHLRVARVSASGEMLERHAEPVGRDPGGLIDRIVALCRQLDHPSVAGIGIGVPGRVDVRVRTVLSGGILDLAGTLDAARLDERIGKAVTIDNDAAMALTAERAYGAARGIDDVVMLTIGTGIGGAIVLGGRTLRGRRAAGQLGHLTVAHDGLACACGRRGCIETTSSGTALGRLIADAGLPPGTRAEALFDAEAASDQRAARVLDAWIFPLRAAIDTVVAAVDPALVVLGGGLGGAACRALQRAPALSPWFDVPVVEARLGDEAGVMGAGLAALEASR